MDIKLPNIDGYNIRWKIRSLKNDLPIIAQTAYALYGDKERAINAGCNDCISKPIERDEFLKIVAKYL